MTEIPAWYDGPLPWEPCARIIADSISPYGHRLTTFEMRFHRFVLAEQNTHLLLSKNSASSRAIPLRSKNRDARTGTLDRLEDNGPAMPLVWPKEQPGMQGATEQVDDLERVNHVWEEAMRNAIAAAELLSKLGLHKSVTNRIIEPYTWHTATISGESWAGYFSQRSLHHTKDAQPEFAAVATMAEDLYNASKPVLVKDNQFHMPYTRPDEVDEYSTADLCKISVARCARTSYLTHDGIRDTEADLVLFNKLANQVPPHGSPFQHVATPDPANEFDYVIDPRAYGLDGPVHSMRVPIVGNTRGWLQLRHLVLGF